MILPLLQSDLLPLLMAAAAGDLAGVKAEWGDDAAVCVVLASAGYPGAYETGYRIAGLEYFNCNWADKMVLFHAGTAFRHGDIVTAGGRVLGLTAWADNLPAAVESVYWAVHKIKYRGCYYRGDIARRALKPPQ